MSDDAQRDELTTDLAIMIGTYGPNDHPLHEFGKTARRCYDTIKSLTIALTDANTAFDAECSEHDETRRERDEARAESERRGAMLSNILTNGVQGTDYHAMRATTAAEIRDLLTTPAPASNGMRGRRGDGKP